MNDFIGNGPIKSPGLAIESGKKLVEAVAALAYKIDGKVFPVVGAGQNLAALTGITIEAGYSCFIGLYVDNAATPAYTAVKGTEFKNPTAATSGYDLKYMVEEVRGKCLIGNILITNGSAAKFVGGATDLDAANITTVCIDNFGLCSK